MVPLRAICVAGMAGVLRLRRLVEIDPRSLAAFRVGLGLVLLSDVVQRARTARVFLTDEGVLPRVDAVRLVSPLQPSLHLAGGDAYVQYALLAVAGVAAAAIVVGYRTKLATAISLILLVSVTNRNPALYHTADQYLLVLLWWALVCPTARVFSVDARARSEAPAGPIASIGTMGLLLQVVVVYAVSTLHKWPSLSFWWTDGTMLSYVLEVDAYTSPWGSRLKAYPELLQGLSRTAFALEAVGPPLALLCAGWPRFRTIIVAAMIGFHASTAITMEVGMFPYVSTVAWLAFVPGLVWDRLGWSPRVAHRIVTRRPWIEHLAGVPATALLVALLGSLVAPLGIAPSPPRWLASASSLTGFTQAWSMFAAPGTDDGWLVVAGTFADGTTQDLLSGGPVTWDRPESIGARPPDDRWRTYLFRVSSATYGDHRRHFARYLCRRHGQGESPLRAIDITYVRVSTRVVRGRPAGEHMPEPELRLGGICTGGDLVIPPRMTGVHADPRREVSRVRSLPLRRHTSTATVD